MNKKAIIIGCVVVALAVAAIIIFRPKQESKSVLETAQVTQIDMSREVTATGTVEPITNVEVGTQVSGIIDKIFVDYNTEVKKGQVLAELDKTTLASDLESQRANVQSAKVEYEFMEKTYNRANELHKKQLISDSEYDQAWYDYQRSKNSYEKAKSDMVKTQTNLGFATIYSPIDGVVLSRAVDEGQTVAASFNTPTLFTIANDLTKMQVVADVDEADIGQVELGQKVTFTVDAFPDDEFKGEVTQIRLEATTTSNVVTYEVIINAPNPDLKLKPGMTANVTIKTLERIDVLSVPSKALNYKSNPNSEEKTVWVMTEGQEPQLRNVKTGFDDRINVEIVSGLNPGETVIVSESVQSNGSSSNGDSQSKSPFMQGPPGRKK